MEIALPPAVGWILQRLEQNGHAAYTVGGCVRDSLMGRVPHDWDVCTEASPGQITDCFNGFRLLDTGAAYGTMTLLLGGVSYEITTFRADGAYRDGRHPERIEFAESLETDLMRRDFTINAMAYHPRRGLADPFGGLRDLRARRIRCVGEPAARFSEDALRILRALRFASTFGFAIEDVAGKAIRRNSSRLAAVSRERVRDELCRLLPGPGAGDVLDGYADTIFAVLPEAAPLRGMRQVPPYQDRDAWTHVTQAVRAAPEEPVLRLAALLLDISADAAESSARRLRMDRNAVSQVRELVLYHKADIPPEPEPVRRWLGRLGETRLRELIAVKRADILGQREETRPARLRRLEETSRCLDRIIARGDCFRLRDLAVGGRDLIAVGIPEGKAVGDILRRLLDGVVSGRIENSRRALLKETYSHLGGENE